MPGAGSYSCYECDELIYLILTIIYRVVLKAFEPFYTPVSHTSLIIHSIEGAIHEAILFVHTLWNEPNSYFHRHILSRYQKMSRNRRQQHACVEGLISDKKTLQGSRSEKGWRRMRQQVGCMGVPICYRIDLCYWVLLQARTFHVVIDLSCIRGGSLHCITVSQQAIPPQQASIVPMAFFAYLPPEHFLSHVCYKDSCIFLHYANNYPRIYLCIACDAHREHQLRGGVSGRVCIFQMKKGVRWEVFDKHANGARLSKRVTPLLNDKGGNFSIAGLE